MATAAETLNLLDARVRWLEGKLTNLRTKWSAFGAAAEAVVRERGPRPAGWAQSLLYGPAIATAVAVPPAALALGVAAVSLDAWLQFDFRWAGRIGPALRDAETAGRRFESLRPQVGSGASASFSISQTVLANRLIGRGNDALRNVQEIARQYRQLPLSRFDPQASMTESAVRSILGMTILPQMGVSSQTAWETLQTITPSGEALTTISPTGAPLTTTGKGGDGLGWGTWSYVLAGVAIVVPVLYIGGKIYKASRLVRRR